MPPVTLNHDGRFETPLSLSPQEERILGKPTFMLLSPRAELAYGGAVAFTVGTTASIPIAAIMKFAVLPAVETFPAYGS
jgi:hypothetical protein